MYIYIYIWTKQTTQTKLLRSCKSYQSQTNTCNISPKSLQVYPTSSKINETPIQIYQSRTKAIQKTEISWNLSNLIKIRYKIYKKKIKLSQNTVKLFINHLSKPKTTWSQSKTNPKHESRSNKIYRNLSTAIKAIHNHQNKFEPITIRIIQTLSIKQIRTYNKHAKQ